MRDAAELARFEATSPRLTSASLALDPTDGGHRLADRLTCSEWSPHLSRTTSLAFAADASTPGGTPSLQQAALIAADHEEATRLTTELSIAAVYSDMDTALQRAAMIMTDHDEAAAEFGPRAPETLMLRDIYAAAVVDAARTGSVAPALEPLVSDVYGTSDAVTMDEMFDARHDGTLFSLASGDVDPIIVAAANARRRRRHTSSPRGRCAGRAGIPRSNSR